MTTTRGSGAVTLQLYERLRADLVRGHFPPGSPLRVSLLSELYDASMTSVREALVRLAEQHLAVLTPNAGFRTATVSPADLIDLTDARVLIECDAARRSVLRGDLRWEAQLVAAHHVLERTDPRRGNEPGSTDEWSVAHASFHDALVAACGSPRLLRLTRSLRDGAELYRQLSGIEGGGRDVDGEHRELLALAVARRGDDAASALERHLRLTADLLLEHELHQAPAPADRERSAR